MSASKLLTLLGMLVAQLTREAFVGPMVTTGTDMGHMPTHVVVVCVGRVPPTQQAQTVPSMLATPGQLGMLHCGVR